MQLPQALFQVCVSLKDKETRERELAALETAMKELSLKQGIVITLYEEERIETPAGLIEAIPAWEWFLERRQPSAVPRRNARKGRPQPDPS